MFKSPRRRSTAGTSTPPPPKPTPPLPSSSGHFSGAAPSSTAGPRLRCPVSAVAFLLVAAVGAFPVVGMDQRNHTREPLPGSTAGWAWLLGVAATTALWLWLGGCVAAE